ncbi:MAG: superoxide dismutase [Chloroflexi bacterium]|nr:superoxide dismutase [Chloroflexota bacterium]
MPLTLPALAYDVAALEPHIDATTMTIHHGKHHAAYVNNANNAMTDHSALQALSAIDILKKINETPDTIRQALINNVGGHANHTLFWEIMAPGGANAPTGALAAAITSTFGGVDQLKAQVNDAAMKRFGSGWGWLVADANGALKVISTANQDSPIMQGLTPLLGVDVWEHAYYLNYQNRRADYLAAWWNVVNWSVVAANYGR